MKKFRSMDEYHSSFDKPVRDILDELREAINQAAPLANEVISYNMPAFKMKKILVYYAAHENHIGFYPTPSAIVIFKDELSKYKTSKGAIQFPIGKPLPFALIKKIVRFRVKEDMDKR